MIPDLKKFLRLPTPIDLGKATSNALPSRRFDPSAKGYTWEDYYADVKRDYAIRYFIFETLGNFLSTYLLFPLKRFRWYVIERWFNKNHLLDLRQASWVPECDEYEWGYLDPRTEMLYACMNSLDRFIHESHARTHLEWLESQLPSADDCEKLVLQDNINLYKEALEIHKWWNVDRKSHFANLCQTDDLSAGRKQTFARWDRFEEEEDEMMIRLMKIRRGLWS